MSEHEQHPVEEELRRDHGFWQFNIGHIGSAVLVIFTMGCAWQNLSAQLEAQASKTSDIGLALAQLQTDTKSLAAQQQSQQNEIISDHQDALDLHKTIETDFERRLSKIEDRQDLPVK